MMFDLKTLEKPKSRAVQVTLVGEGGSGKTSLAATFPNPVFIRTEDGMLSLGENAPMAFPVATSSEEVAEQIRALGREDHDFKTLVIDSISKLHTIIEKEITEADGSRSINQAMGGYGAGYAAAAERHRQIKSLCDKIVAKKGMNVVFIAHADEEKIDPPDNDPYTRYTLRIHHKSVAHYSDDVDLVGFIKMKTWTVRDKEKESGKAFSDGTRVVTCYPVPSHISKNRFGISEDLPFEAGANPFKNHIKSLSEE